MARSPRIPWKRQNPRKHAGKAAEHLTTTKKSTAKTRASRDYPNLVDKLAIAAKKGAKTKTSGRKRAAKSSGARSASKPTIAAKRSTSSRTRKH